MLNIRSLYDWLGNEIARLVATSNDWKTPDAKSLQCGQWAEAYASVRQQMRRMDPSLPAEDVDDLV